MLGQVFKIVFLTFSFHTTYGTILTKFKEENVSGGPTNVSIIAVRSTLNRDKSYGRWPSSRILYKIGSGYSA